MYTTQFCTQTDASLIEDIAALESICFSEPWSGNALTDFLSYPHNFALVTAADDGHAAAYVTFCISDTVLEIANICTSPDHRRKGLAEGLMERLRIKAKESGCDSIYLEVRESNASARAFYEKAGFITLSRVNRLFSHPSEAGFRMSLPL